MGDLTQEPLPQDTKVDNQDLKTKADTVTEHRMLEQLLGDEDTASLQLSSPDEDKSMSQEIRIERPSSPQLQGNLLVAFLQVNDKGTADEYKFRKNVTVTPENIVSGEAAHTKNIGEKPEITIPLSKADAEQFVKKVIADFTVEKDRTP